MIALPQVVLDWLAATGALIVWAAGAPWTPVIAGALFGGIALGASKNRTAITELARGIIVGLVAFGVAWVIRQATTGGA